MLNDGDGGFLGGLNAEKYMKMTGASKATATRDLSEMVTGGQLWSRGLGKAVRYYINVPGWSHGVAMESDLGGSDTDAVPVANDKEPESWQSEQNVRAALKAGGYTVSEKSGEQDRQYVGPVVAISTLHIAQDIGRRQAVIHDIRLLNRAPVMGDWLNVKIKAGCGTVTDMGGEDCSR